MFKQRFQKVKKLEKKTVYTVVMIFKNCAETWARRVLQKATSAEQTQRCHLILLIHTIKWSFIWVQQRSAFSFVEALEKLLNQISGFSNFSFVEALEKLLNQISGFSNFSFVEALEKLLNQRSGFSNLFFWPTIVCNKLTIASE